MKTVFLVIVGSVIGLLFQEEDALGALTGGVCAYLLGQSILAGKIHAELRESIRAANEQLWDLRNKPDRAPALEDEAEAASPDEGAQPISEKVSVPVVEGTGGETSERAFGEMDAETPVGPPSEKLEPSIDIETQRAASAPAPQAKMTPDFDLVAVVLSVVRAFFTEGNSIVRVGMLVLLVGVALLGKYAIEHDLLPIELRLMGAGALGLALFVFGYLKRDRRPDVALVLQGGGLGAMYITVFFAMNTYELLPRPIGFALLVALTGAGIAAAASQNALSLAIYAVLGGFLAPIVASSGNNNFVFLFSYYTILNLGILGTGWLKNWRPLNLLGFVLTFGVASVWGGLKYEPEFYLSVQPFLIIFFLIYWLLPIFYAQGRADQLEGKTGRLDSTLIFGTPLATFALQHELVADTRYGVAFSCLGLAALYLASAGYSLRRARGSLRHLGESHLALAVGFATLAIPFALSDHRFTGALWALEGAGAYWVGVRQNRKFPRLLGILLQGLAAAAFAQSGPSLAPETTTVSGSALGGAIIALGGVLVAWSAFRYRNDSTRVGGIAPTQLFFVWGLLWWAGSLREQLYVALGAHEAHAFWFIGCSISVFFGFFWGRVQNWSLPQSTALWALVPVVFNIVEFAGHYDSPLAGDATVIGGGVAGYVAWPLWVFGYLFLLKTKSKELSLDFTPWFHGLWAALVTGLLTWEVVYRINEKAPDADNWIIGALVFVPAIASLMIQWARTRAVWPVSGEPAGYLGVQGLISVFHGLTLLLVLSADSEMAPLAYVPLLNPIDGAQIVAIVSWLFCLKNLRQAFPPEVTIGLAMAKWLLAIAAVLWANSVVARSVSAYADVPYQMGALLDSQILQMALTMFWTLVGLTLVLAAHHKQRRNWWWLGAAILGLVIVKLFAVDLAKIGTLLRTITFLAVGMLLVLVGYKAPLPRDISTRAKHPS